MGCQFSGRRESSHRCSHLDLGEQQMLVSIPNTPPHLLIPFHSVPRSIQSPEIHRCFALCASFSVFYMGIYP